MLREVTYYLKAFWQTEYQKVTQEQFNAAETLAGFQAGSTSGFSSSYFSGKIEFGLPITLAKVLPSEFYREFGDHPANGMLGVGIVVEHTQGRWPGPEKHVYVWWMLENGCIIGWNENPSRGWSFPMYGPKSKYNLEGSFYAKRYAELSAKE